MLLRTLTQLFRRNKPPLSAAAGASFATAHRLYQEGKLDDAAAECGNIHDIAQADVHYLLGLIARERRSHEQAAAEFEMAVAARDTEPSFHYSLAETLIDLGRQDDARQHVERFLALAPDGDPRTPRAWMLLFSCSVCDEDAATADECHARAIAAAADDPSALIGIADSFYLEAQISSARATIQRSIESHDIFSARVRRAAMLPQVYESRAEIEQVRQRFAADLDELLSGRATPTDSPQTEVGILPFYLAYHNENNVKLLEKFCAVARRAFHARTEPLRPRRRSEQIRVGFVSTYFYSHSVGRTTLGLIRDLPRPRFCVHAFAIAPATDPLANAIAAAADNYYSLKNDTAAISEAIAEAKLDVLIFADIGMHPTTYFIALERLAPIQIATWGHSETSGIDTIDYYLSADDVECATAQMHYSETLIRPKAFFLPGYEPPAVWPAVSAESLGLPPGFRRYSCLQPEFKLHPDMDGVFKGILEQDPKAEILLLVTRPSWSRLLRQRLRRSLGELVQQLRFLPRMRNDRFLATLAASDVCLDPLYFGGCNSSCEAMALGVPIVTLPGRHLHGRFTAALYHEMGIHDCVAECVGDYVERAIGLARNRDHREAVKGNILQRNEILFGRKDITLALAHFLEERLSEAM